MVLLEDIKKVREYKKRNFNQTFDLIINLKEINLNKAESKIDEHFVLPKGLGEEASVTFFSDSDKKMEGCKVVKGMEIEGLSANKKELKKIIDETDFFLSEPKLMPVIGKYLGKYLAPRGMMPTPVVGNLDGVIMDIKKSIKLKLGKQPIIHTIVGSEKMDDKDLEENIKALLAYLQKKLPRGKNNIKNVYLKTTMGHPVKIEVV